MTVKRGDTVKCPWAKYGDDTNLTGIVTSVTRGKVVVRWNGDGDVTPEGDESTFIGYMIDQLEKVEA